MIEKREWRRAVVNLDAACCALLQDEKFKIKVIDINENGLCFTAPMSMKPGRKIRIEMEIPGEGQIWFDLKVVWSGYFEKNEQYRAGAKIIGMDAAHSEKYLRFYNAKLLSPSFGG